MVDLPRGFLPIQDPLPQLPHSFAQWEAFAKEIPKILLTNQYRQLLLQLSPFPTDQLTVPEEWERAMLILSYLGQAYVWADLHHPAHVIPEVLAVPWHKVAYKLARPPILSYASYALYNWRRLDPKEKVELGNIILLQNFLGGMDEEWFILVHVNIEAEAALAINALVPAIAASQANDGDQVLKQLQIIKQSLEKMCLVLKRMPERCDPYIYFNRVRPYIHGWQDNPALPEGVIYQGVAEYGHNPVKFKGETGAQSTIVPIMDAFFGVEHEDNPLQQHLIEMKEYMPALHRDFLAAISKQSQIRAFIEKNKNSLAQLAETYNACLELLYQFRATHLSYAAHYIQQQSRTTSGNPTDIGTGGTPFMEYLRKHLAETRRYFL
ncbi:MAG: hypothetical protein JSR33_07835 [Proteobacteria bacterium]|nr:hypothetical protein [Pseudomonadota bacterium]